MQFRKKPLTCRVSGGKHQNKSITNINVDVSINVKEGRKPNLKVYGRRNRKHLQ